MALARMFNPHADDLVEHYPNALELAADRWVHLIALGAAAIGGVALVGVSWMKGGALNAAAPLLYALCLVVMLTCSALYNLSRPNRARFLLRTLDEAAIFLMIAGSYTPFLVSALDGLWRIGAIALVWSIALAGVAGKLLAHHLSERFWCGVYIGFGWLAVAIMAPLSASLSLPVLALLAIGGVIYTAGVLFFLQPTLPFRRAVWHGFVAAAATVHYVAVLATVAS